MVTKPVSDEEILETIEAYIRCGYNQSAAARDLGVSSPTIGRRIKMAIDRGLYTDGQIKAPPPSGHLIKGVSSLVDADGNVKLQWIKTAQDKDAAEAALQAAIDAVKEEIPRLAPIVPPEYHFEDLCNVYTMTDCHVGMLAWHREVGDDWDLDIAERILSGCFEQMVIKSPKARVGIVAQLGDFLHSDGLLPVTPTSGNILDQDGRFEKVVAVAIRILRRTIDFALHHHEQVHVLMAEGNHDMASSIWLRQLFEALYEDEPRVTVETSPLPYYSFEWGEVSLFWHHGHLKKMENLNEVFSTEFAPLWGRTTRRYAHSGHQHHVKLLDRGGVELRQHATLATRDAYAARHGYSALRHVKAFSYHRKYGEVRSETIWPEMLEKDHER